MTIEETQSWPASYLSTPSLQSVRHGTENTVREQGLLFLASNKLLGFDSSPAMT